MAPHIIESPVTTVSGSECKLSASQATMPKTIAAINKQGTPVLWSGEALEVRSAVGLLGAGGGVFGEEIAFPPLHGIISVVGPKAWLAAAGGETWAGLNGSSEFDVESGDGVPGSGACIGSGSGVGAEFGSGDGSGGEDGCSGACAGFGSDDVASGEGAGVGTGAGLGGKDVGSGACVGSCVDILVIDGAGSGVILDGGGSVCLVA